MGLRDLQKLLDREQEKEQSTADAPAMRALINRCRNVPFYYWGRTTHHTTPTNCNICFNCIIGLPRKGNQEYPLFDYEHMIYRALMEPAFLNTRKATEEENKRFEQMKVAAELQSQTKKGNIGTAFAKYLKEREDMLVWPQKVKHLAVLKATGLGISELCIRFLAWFCLRNDNLRGSQIVIFTGPRLELAVTLVSRLKDLFRNQGITFTDKETVCNLNGVRIEAFPSHHADSARGLSNISACLIDEFSFIPDRETDNIMDIMLRNVPKSNPYLIAISTPRQQNDAMYKLLNEKYEVSPFKWLKLDWSYGLDKIFTQEEIDKIRNSRSWEREYNLKFSGLEGNLLSETAIQRCISTGEKLAETAPLDDWSIPTNYVMSIDVGWSGASATAIMISRFISGKVQILYSKEFYRETLFQEIIDEVWRLKNRCHGNLKCILMDASATELYTTLCNEFNQNASQKYLRDKQAWCKQTNSNIMQYLFVCPIPFNPMTKTMTQHTQRLIQETDYDGSALVGIHNQFENVITSCHSAYVVEDKLDKERTVHADTFDALRMNLQYYNFGDK